MSTKTFVNLSDLQKCRTELESRGLHGRLLQEIFSVVSSELANGVGVEEMIARIDEHCSSSGKVVSDEVEELLATETKHTRRVMTLLPADEDESDRTIGYCIIADYQGNLRMSMEEWQEEMDRQNSMYDDD